MKTILPTTIAAIVVSALPTYAQKIVVPALSATPVQVAIKADGAYLYTVQPATATAHAWEVATGKLVWVLSVPGASGPIVALPDGRLAVAVREEIGPTRGNPPQPEPIDSVRLIKMGSKSVVALRLPNTDLRRTITTLSLSTDGKTLLAGTFALTRSVGERGALPYSCGEIVTWDISAPTQPGQLRSLASGTGISRIVLTNTDTAMALMGNGSTEPILFSQSAKETDVPLQSVPMGRFGAAGESAISSDGKWLAILRGNQLVIRPVGETNSEAERPIRAIDNPARIAFLPDLPTRLVVVTRRNEIVSIDPETGTVLDKIPGGSYDSVSSLVVGPKNRLVVVRDDGMIRTWDITAKRLLSIIPVVAREPRTLAAAGDALLAADSLGRIRLWDTRSNTIRWSTHTAVLAGSAAALLTPDGTKAFIASESLELLAFDTQTGKSLWINKENGGFGAMALSPDGKTLAVIRRFPTEIRLLDTETGMTQATFPQTDRTAPLPISLAFSPDGTTLSTLSSRGRTSEVRQLDAKDGTLKQTNSLNEPATTIQYLPGGQSIAVTLLSFGRSAALVLLPANAKGEARHIELDPILPGDPPRSVMERPLSIALSPNGKSAVIGTVGGGVTICDAMTGQVRKRLPAPSFATVVSATGSGGTAGTTAAIAFGSNDTLAVSDASRSIRFFDLPTGTLQKTVQFLDLGIPTDTDPWLWTIPTGKWNASANVRPLIRQLAANGTLQP